MHGTGDQEHAERIAGAALSGLFRLLALVSYAVLGAALLAYATDWEPVKVQLAGLSYVYGIAGCGLVYFFFDER